MHFIKANANQELHDVASDKLKNKADLKMNMPPVI